MWWGKESHEEYAARCKKEQAARDRKFWKKQNKSFKKITKLCNELVAISDNVTEEN